MAAQVVPFFQRLRRPSDWAQAEIAQFYRVESALLQAGLRLQTDRGVTDEGDPWFVFCRADDGEVFIHFSRIEGKYIVISSGLDRVFQGPDFNALVNEMLAAQAYSLPRARNRNNIFLHPATLLVALVSGAFFHSGAAKAATVADARPEQKKSDGFGSFALKLDPEKASTWIDPYDTTAVLSSVLIGLNASTPIGTRSEPALAAGGAIWSAAFTTPAPTSADLAVYAAPVSFSDVAPSTGGGGAPPPPPPPPTPPPSAPAISSGPPPAVAAHLDVFNSVAMPSPEAAQALAPPPPTVIDVPATSLALPPGEAAAVFQSLGPLPGMTVVATLAPAVADALSRADNGSTAQTPTPDGSAGQTPTPDGSAGQTPTSDGSTQSQAPTSDGQTTADSSAPVVSGASQPVTPAVLPSATPVAMNADDLATKSVALQFVSELKIVDVTTQGNQIVIYEGMIGHLPASIPLDAVSFTLHDGTSISLVGTASEIQALHLPHHP
jgi:hypothetical protein